MARLIRDISSGYDSDTGRIRLRRNASPYEIAHEHAHHEQRTRGTWIWHLYRCTRYLPYLRQVTHLLMEWEAMTLAHRSMRARGIPVTPGEGWRHLAGYMSSFTWVTSVVMWVVRSLARRTPAPKAPAPARSTVASARH